MIKFTKEHEWLRLAEGKTAMVGVSAHGIGLVGALTGIRLPKTGEVFAKGEPFGVLEGEEKACDVFMPVSATVTAVNTLLESHPQILSGDPENLGWLAKIEILNPSELDELMSKEEYLCLL